MSGVVIEFEEHRGQWVITYQRCRACGHEQGPCVHRLENDLDRMQCVRCKAMTAAVFKFAAVDEDGNNDGFVVRPLSLAKAEP